MKKFIVLLVMMMLCAASSSSVLVAETKTVVTVSATNNSKAEETQWVLNFEQDKVVTIKGVKYTLKGEYQVYRGSKGGLYILVEGTYKYYLTEAMKKLLK